MQYNIYPVVTRVVIGMEQIIGRVNEKAQVASVLLLTDGLANVGISNREGIMEEMRKIIDPPSGHTVRYFDCKIIYFITFYCSHLKVQFIPLDLVQIMMHDYLSQYLHKVEVYTITLTQQRRSVCITQ